MRFIRNVFAMYKRIVPIKNPPSLCVYNSYHTRREIRKRVITKWVDRERQRDYNRTIIAIRRVLSLSRLQSACTIWHFCTLGVTQKLSLAEFQIQRECRVVLEFTRSRILPNKWDASQQVGRQKEKRYVAEIFMIDASDRRGGSERLGSSRLVVAAARWRAIVEATTGRKRKKIHRYMGSRRRSPTVAVSNVKWREIFILSNRSARSLSREDNRVNPTTTIMRSRVGRFPFPYCYIVLLHAHRYASLASANRRCDRVRMNPKMSSIQE